MPLEFGCEMTPPPKAQRSQPGKLLEGSGTFRSQGLVGGGKAIRDILKGYWHPSAFFIFMS